MTTIKVFTNSSGQYGNPVGIIVDEVGAISKEERQQMAADSGYSEIVFIDYVKAAKVSIFNPTSEIDFAGHALLGAVYELEQLSNIEVKSINCRGGHVSCRKDGDIYWLEADASMLPEWQLEQLDSASAVEMLTVANTAGKEHTYCWAWIDEQAGLVRARTFAPDWGIPEDEANGSGAMKLAHDLGREILVTHGQGSEIYARPMANNRVEVGGRIIAD